MAFPPPLSRATAGPGRLGGLQQQTISTGTIDGARTFSIAYAVDSDQDLVSVAFITDTTDAADATNYWSFQVQNAGTDGSGSTAMMTAVTTVAADLNGITAQVPENFTLTSNRLLKGEVAKLVILDPGGSATTLVSGLIIVTLKRISTYV